MTRWSKVTDVTFIYLIPSKYIPGIYLLLYIILTGITAVDDEMNR